MATKAERSVDHRYFIRASPDAVFRAITDPQSLTKWLCDRAELMPKKGGTYLLGWNDGPTHTGKVTDFRKGRRISLAWNWPGVSLEGTIFSLSVSAEKEGTILVVKHTGFPKSERWADLYGGAEWGWAYFAMNLKSLLESGRDLRSEHDG